MQRWLGPLLLAGGVLAAVSVLAPPDTRTLPPDLDVAYAVFVGRIELRAQAQATLATPAGRVQLLANRFGPLVRDLQGLEVEIEGLLLTVERRPLLWIEAIRVDGREIRPRRSTLRPHEIPI
jgi:hypothetical protein